MKKHLRLWAIVMTAFMLVGIMTSAALAGAKTVTTLEVTSDADNDAITLLKDDSTTVTLTVNCQNVVAKDTLAETPVTLTATAAGSSIVSITQPESVNLSKTGSTASTPEADTTFTVKGLAAGTTKITVVASVAENEETGQGALDSEAYELSVTVKVISTPVISADTTPIVWGQEWSLEPSDKSDSPAATGTWSTTEDISELGLQIDPDTGAITLDEDSFEDGIWNPGAATLKALNGDKDWTGEDITKTIHLTYTESESGSNMSDTKDVTLTFQGIDLAVDTENSTGATSDDWKDITTDTNLTGSDVKKIIITGPGTISFDISGLPEGINYEFAESESDASRTVTFSGQPTETCVSNDVVVKATINGGTKHAKELKLVVSVLPGEFTIKNGDDPAEVAMLPNGWVKNGDEFDKVTLKAAPGPITWSGYQFLIDAGLTVTVSNDELIISGKYNVTNTVSADYAINAANSNYPATSSDVKVAGEDKLTVWVAPTFDDAYLYQNPSDTKGNKIWKADYIKAEGDWAKTLGISNVPDPTSFDVTIGTIDILVNSEAQKTEDVDNKYVAIDSSANSDDEYGVYAKVSGDTVVLVGSVDRIPEGGTVDVKVIARNHAGETEKKFTVKVIGDTTTIDKKNDITLGGYGMANSGDIKIITGQPTQIMTATIDAKTAQKVFGLDGNTAIDLVKDGPTYGIYIDSKDMEYGKLKIYMPTSGDAAEGEYVDAEGDWKAYAFKKLPIVVTTKNPDFDFDAKTGKAIDAKKIATQKATLSYPSNAKDAVAKFVAPFAEKLAENGLSVSEDWGAIDSKKEELCVAQGVKIEEKYATEEGSNNPFIFVAEGNGPFTLTIKPTAETNGLTAKEIEYETEDGFIRKAVEITGTPTAAAKDVATKFSITAKNNSTGTSAKATITVTAMPVVAIDTTKGFGNTSAKPATVNGKLKVSPKITANSKNIYWSIVSADWDGNEMIGSQDLFDKYGIELSDPIKGVLSTPKGAGLKMATGTTTPLKVLLQADTLNVATKKATAEQIAAALENPLTSSYATAEIYIAGEKLKVNTKSVTVTISGDASSPTYDYGDPIEFLAGKTSATSVDTGTEVFSGKGHSASYYKAYMAPTDTYAYDKSSKPTYGTTMNTVAANFAGDKVKAYLEGLKLVVSGDNINAFKLSGTPKAATKKAALDLVMNNWGTVTTGKVSVIIKGQKPLPVAAPASVTLDSNDKTGQDVTITLSNKDYVGSKIKWKVTSKTTGVKAKFKAAASDKTGKEGGTLTITTDKKFTTAQTVTLTATDGDDKNNIGTVEIKVTPSFAASGSSSALEATDDTMSAKDEAEAKVLGEGTVTMHGQRTVASLTAGQRAQIEAQGYIVAAVLPEIEVDADGQYDFEVDLDADERVKAGDELVWFAFASKPTTDDEIVDFEDVDGNETKVVPEIAEGHEHPVVVAWPWLNAGTKYAPVIAVKADAAEADAMTEEGVKEAAEEAKEE